MQLGDRNLLFGILALEDHLISRDELVAAVKAWVADKSKGMAQILREHNALSENNQAVVEERVHNHLAERGNDPERGLADVRLVDSVKRDLEKIDDPDLSASLARVARPIVNVPAPDEEAPIMVTPTPRVTSAAKPLTPAPIKVTPKRKTPPVEERKSGLIVALFAGAAIFAFVFLLLAGSVVGFFLYKSKETMPIAGGDKPALKDEDKRPLEKDGAKPAGGDKPAFKDEGKRPLEKDGAKPDDKMPPIVIPPVVKEVKPGEVIAPAPPPAVAPQGDFVQLFNGKNLAGWKEGETGKETWRIENGLLVGAMVQGKSTSLLATQDVQPKDFHLRIEARSDKGAGAVFVRSPTSRTDGYESNFQHSLIKGNLRAGGLAASVPGHAKLLTPAIESKIAAGEWFNLDFIVEGNRVIVKLNGETTADAIDDTHVLPGVIVLKAASAAKVEFRKIEIKALKPAAVAALIAPPPKQFRGNGQFHVHIPAGNMAKWRVENNELVEDQLKGSMQMFFGDPKWRDYDFSIDAMRTAGDGQAGLWFRRPHDNDGYFFGFGIKGDKIMVTRMAGGNDPLRQLLTVKDHVVNNRWHNAKVSVRGDKAVCYFDGAKICEFKVDKIVAGSVGLRTWFTPYRFKNIKVAAPDGTVLLEGLPDFEMKPPALPPMEIPKGGAFVPLWNGNNLNDWLLPPNQKANNWRIEGGVLLATGNARSRILLPRDDYKDFHLKMEARISDQGAASVIVRGQVHPGFGIEARINANHSTPDRTGSLLRHIPNKSIHLISLKDSPVPAGEWFQLELFVVKDRIAISVNGKSTADFVGIDPDYMFGHIAFLQEANSRVEFRKVEIKEFPTR